MSGFKDRLTYANVMATVAVFIALGGGAYAVGVAKNSVGTKQLKDDAVVSDKVEDGSLVSKDFKRSELPNGQPGAQGPAGPTGPAGATGPLGDAGGDLTGSYPSPTLSTKPAVRVYGVQALSRGVCAAGTYPTEDNAVHWQQEAFDTQALHEPGATKCATPSERLTAPRDGYYAVDASISWVANPDGVRGVSIQVNGGDFVASERRNASVATEPTMASTSTLVRLEAGQYVTIHLYQSSNTYGTVNQDQQSSAAMYWVSPL